MARFFKKSRESGVSAGTINEKHTNVTSPPSANTPSPTFTPAGASPSGALLLATIGYSLAIRRKNNLTMETENSVCYSPPPSSACARLITRGARDAERQQMNRPSGLRPPSTRLPQFSSSTASLSQGLHEITDSQNNTRAHISAMVPPSAISGIKRGPQGVGTIAPPSTICAHLVCLQETNAVAQPDPKRKTLAEKAGSEFPNAPKSNLAAPAPARNMLKGASLKDIQAVSRDFFCTPSYRLTGMTDHQATFPNLGCGPKFGTCAR